MLGNTVLSCKWSFVDAGEWRITLLLEFC